jgi:hypothetical protein
MLFRFLQLKFLKSNRSSFCGLPGKRALKKSKLVYDEVKLAFDYICTLQYWLVDLGMCG